MPEDTGGQPGSSWLREPPGQGEIHVEVGLGSDVELSPEARSALERLLSSLEANEEAEVAGFACVIGPCPDYKICKSFGHCMPRETGTCLAWVHCRIGVFD